MGLFDFITNIGGLYLSDRPSLNTGHILNLFLPDSPAVSVFYSFFPYFLNYSIKVPIQNNGTLFPYNYTLNANPNFFITIFSITWMLSFFVVVLLFISATIYHICHQTHTKTNVKKGIIKIKTKRTFKKVNRNRNTSIRKFLIGIITFFVIFTILWAVLFCLFCISHYVIQSKWTQSNDSSNNSFASISTALNYSFLQLNNFYNVMTVDSTIFLQSSVSNLSTSVTNLIQFSVTQFVNSMLIQYQIRNVFNDADQLINSLDIDTKSMGFIKENYKSTFNQINKINGSISVYQQDIKDSLGSLCRKLTGNDNLQKTCFSLQTRNAQFSTLINTSKIDAESSIIMIFLLEELQINISKIVNNYRDVNSSFNANINSSLSSVSREISVFQYLNTINDIWTKSFLPAVSPYFEKSFEYKNTSFSLIKDIFLYENIFIIILILLIIITIILVLYSFCKVAHIKRRHSKHSICCSCCFPIFVTLFSFLWAVLSIALLLFCIYINAEVCRQFNTTEGVKLSDQMLNVKLKEPWKNFVSTLSINNFGIPVNINQPVDIISGINTRCRNKSIGTFEVFGIRNLVNVTEIIKSTGIVQNLVDTQSSSSKYFLNIDPNQLISSDTEDFLQKAKANISLFDKTDYSVSIQELSIPLTGVTDFVTFFNDLKAFVQNSFKQLGNINELVILNKTSHQLLANKDIFIQTQISVWNMLSYYIDLQAHRNNSLFLNQLLSDINIMRAFLKNKTNLEIIYNKTFITQIIGTMLSRIINIIDANLTSMTSQLLPCDSVSLIMEAVTTTICTKDNITDGLVASALLLVMVTVMVQLILILIIIFEICYNKCERRTLRDRDAFVV